MCPQLRHHESAKIRLEAQRQTQVMFHQWASVNTRQDKSLSDYDFEGSQPSECVRVRENRQKPTGGWLVTKSWLLWIIKRTSYWAECYHDKIVPVFVSLSGRHVSIIFSIEIIIFHYLTPPPPPPSSLPHLQRERERARPICICWGAPSAKLHYLKVILWLLCIL